MTATETVTTRITDLLHMGVDDFGMRAAVAAQLWIKVGCEIIASRIRREIVPLGLYLMGNYMTIPADIFLIEFRVSIPTIIEGMRSFSRIDPGAKVFLQFFSFFQLFAQYSFRFIFKAFLFACLFCTLFGHHDGH